MIYLTFALKMHWGSGGLPRLGSGRGNGFAVNAVPRSHIFRSLEILAPKSTMKR